MRRLGLGIGAGLLLFAVACGQPDQVGFGGAPTPTPSSAEQAAPPPNEVTPPDGNPVDFPPPAGRTRIAAAKVDATALPQGYPSTVWVEGNSSAIGVYGQGGGCTEVTASATKQDADQVVVRIVETTTTAGACTLELRFPPLTVKLDKALGSRTVVLEREQVGPR